MQRVRLLGWLSAKTVLSSFSPHLETDLLNCLGYLSKYSDSKWFPEFWENATDFILDK